MASLFRDRTDAGRRLALSCHDSAALVLKSPMNRRIPVEGPQLLYRLRKDSAQLWQLLQNHAVRPETFAFCRAAPQRGHLPRSLRCRSR